MGRRVEYLAGVALIAGILVISAWSLPQMDGDSATGQGTEGGVSPELSLRSELDVEIFAVTLAEDDLRADIEEKLDAGWGVRHIGMKKDATYSNGHRDYSGAAGFISTGNSVDVIRWDYEYKDDVASPAIPPDTLTHLEENPTGVTGLDEIKIPDSVAYEFLVDEVLADPPQDMIDLLDTHELQELWIEKVGTGTIVYRMYLKYVDTSGGTRTEMIWATYAAGVFGTLDSTF